MNTEHDDLYRQLTRAAADGVVPGDALRARVLEASVAALPQGWPAELAADAARPCRPPLLIDAPEEMIAGRCVRRGYGLGRRLAAAAAVAVLMFGGWTLWPKGSGRAPADSAWWLGPPAAWAAQIDGALTAARIKGVTCREQIIIVDPDGGKQVSSTATKYYLSSDSYRRDIYNGEVLRDIQWYTPEDGGMLQSSVRFDTKTCSIVRHEGRFSEEDPVERLRFHVRVIDRADRRWGPEIVDGRQCVGFEIRASQYGDNPDTWLDRIWFDAVTRLPVRIEQNGRPVTGNDGRTYTVIQSDFDYDPVLSANTFTPVFPEGFTLDPNSGAA